MMRAKFLIVWVLLSTLIVWGAYAKMVTAQEAPTMKKEELKKRMGSPDLIIVDVRSGRDWKASEFKIKTAVHEDPNDFDSWSAKYPMEKTIVIYCA